jgi:hypothetical protein
MDGTGLLRLQKYLLSLENSFISPEAYKALETWIDFRRRAGETITNSDDTTRVETTTTTVSYSPTLSEQRHSVDRALDESRKEIPRRTQAFNDYQEHSPNS